MHNVLQSIVDTFLLAAGSVQLGSTGYASSDHARNMPPRAAAKPLRAPLGERAEPKPFVREPAFQASAEKSQR